MEIHKNLDLENIDGEIWKEIEGYDGDYFISNFGRVKSFKGISERILRQNEDGGGYLFISLSGNGKIKTKYVHHLVYETFNNYKLRKNEVIHHINFTLENNINNLKLMADFDHRSLHNKGENNPMFGVHKYGKNAPMYGKYHTEDSIKKIRQNHFPQKGENNNNSVLTNRKVIQIKMLFKLGFKNKEISEIFRVKPNTISQIRTKRTWSHVEV